jgi:hypothetical protein
VHDASCVRACDFHTAQGVALMREFVRKFATAGAADAAVMAAAVEVRAVVSRGR